MTDQDGQPMTWEEGMKNLTSGLTCVGASRLPNLGPPRPLRQ